MDKLFVAVYGCYFLLFKEIMTLQLQSCTACYGSIGLDNFLQPSCATGEKMAVVGLHALAKKISTSCPFEITISNVEATKDTCCHFDQVDCSIPLENSLYRNYYQQCNGKEECIRQVTWVPTTCNQTVYLARTNYMKMDYYCIFDQGQDPCSNLNTKDSRVFLWNSGYPSSSLTGSSTCTCSVEASCDSTVMLTAIDLRLGTNTTCDQGIIITDGSTVIWFDCRDNNNYLPETIYVSTSHFIQIQIVDNLGFADGYYFILIEGVSNGAELTLSCGSTAQVTPTVPFTSLPDCPSTDVTSDSTITRPVNITEVSISSEVQIPAIKSTNVETMTNFTVMDTSTTGVITAESNTGMTTPNNVGKATELPSTVGATTKTDSKTIESTSVETTITIGTPIEKTVIRTKGITSTEKDVIDNRTITTISSVSESFQNTSFIVSEQTAQRNVTETTGESSSSRSVIIGAFFATLVTLTIAILLILYIYKIKESCGKKETSTSKDVEDNTSCHSIFDNNLNFINRPHARKLPTLKHCLHEPHKKLTEENEPIEEVMKTQKRNPRLADKHKQSPREQYERAGIVNENNVKQQEQYERAGIVNEKNVKQKKKRRKQKKFYNKIKDSKLVEYKLKPRSY